MGFLDAVRMFCITAARLAMFLGNGASFGLRLPCTSFASLVAAASYCSPLVGLLAKNDSFCSGVSLS